ncbi:hypothetical protein ACHAWT_002195 [Skeletonema menzelii]
MSAAPSTTRGPLAHIVDALRIDNHQLLVETLRCDPRYPSNDEGNHNTVMNAGDAAAGDHHPRSAMDDAAPNNTHSSASHHFTNSATTATSRQRLIFGSDNLRRTILHQVIARRVSVTFDEGETSSTNNKNTTTTADTKKSKKKNQNKSQAEEEQELMNELNEELVLSSTGGGRCEIVKCSEVLSPLGDGSLLLSSKTKSSNVKKGSSKNPFDDGPFNNNNSTIEEDEEEDDDPTITTYLLRGGGFDIPSVASAALHRNRIVSSRYHQHQQSRLFRFVFLPRMTEMERLLLKELGVQDDIIVESGNVVVSTATAGSVNSLGGGAVNSLESVPIDLIPLDDDVLSLELSGGSGSVESLSIDRNSNSESDKGGGIGSSAAAASLRHSDVEGCEADVVDVVARSLLKLQLLNQGGGGGGSGGAAGRESDVGVIGRVLGLGPLATAVIDRMMYLRLEEDRMDAQAEEEEEDDDDDEDDGGEYNDEEILENTTAVGVETVASPSTGGGGGGSSDNGSKQPPIQALLVIDRKIDLVTPMLTPLTYEGLIDDVLQIQVGGCVSVKKSIVEPDDQTEQQNQRARGYDTKNDSKVLLPLNDSDPLYTEVRDKHVEVFGSFLQNQAKALKESHSQFTNRETARDLSEIHQFVKQIPVFTRNLRSLKNHIHIAELVKSAAEATSFRQRWQTERSMLESESQYDMLEDLIASGEPPYRWLRLFCLQSLTSNGIKATRYESLRKEVVQTYGFEFLMVLNDLEKAGFLRKRETFFMDSMATSYSTLRKSLNLINAEVDPSNPDDPAYVSSGYAPITVRWVQAAMRGYLGLDEALKELPSSGGSGGGRRWIDIEQKSPPESLVEALKQDGGSSLGVLAKKLSDSTSEASGGEQQEKKPVLLVYYVGGITYMEIAALRFLSKRASFPYSIICCTTEIVNGETLLRSLSC